ncbi:MAG: hypothetical protein JRJ12_16755, partial [Deltaproteobacteria bacterium]|nr:hypothetical protein [Deltaproteobacteria bacterium]
MKDVLSMIKLHEREGNFNAAILYAVANYQELALVRPEILRCLRYFLEEHRPLISPEALDAIRSLPTSHLHHSGIRAVLALVAWQTPKPAAGSIVFPVVTSFGMVREIVVREEHRQGLAAPRLQLLDRVGSATFGALGKLLARRCLWRPERFHVDILDPYGREDLQVHGESMGLALALALCSLIAGIPVPLELSASAMVARDGSILPAANMEEKLATLARERFFLKQVLVSDRQDIGDSFAGLQLLKVGSLEQALVCAFPDLQKTACLKADVEIDSELQALERQYDLYLFDTCIENAASLISILQRNRARFPPDRAIPALFTCYWKKGSCHCHRGEVGGSRHALEKAVKLYEKFSGYIRSDDYLDAQISYAVTLKDIFRYQEAEELHFQLMREMDARKTLAHVRGKNLSTLSQLYLAMRRFEEAETYQRLAMGLINREELCRNYGYLAQIHTRAGNFRKAAAALASYRRLLGRAPRQVRSSHTPYYHWIRAEYLYKRLIML